MTELQESYKTDLDEFYGHFEYVFTDLINEYEFIEECKHSKDNDNTTLSLSDIDDINDFMKNSIFNK